VKALGIREVGFDVAMEDGFTEGDILEYIGLYVNPNDEYFAESIP